VSQLLAHGTLAAEGILGARGTDGNITTLIKPACAGSQLRTGYRTFLIVTSHPKRDAKPQKDIRPIGREGKEKRE